MDAAYREATKGSLFVVEDHTFYLRELRVGAEFTITSYVVDYDEKRIYLRQEMHALDTLRAVYESLQLHVSRNGGVAKAAPMPSPVLAALEAAKVSEAEAAAFTHRAGAIGVRRSTPPK